MKPLFLDVETTGLPPKGSNWREHWKYFPHIVSISWIFNREHDYIIKPEGYEIPPEATAIHGITNDQAKGGHDLGIILRKFCDDAMRASVIVGHNIHFDTSIVQANTLRLNTTILMMEIGVSLDKDRRLCTMLSSTKFCGRTHDNGRPRWPTLEYLYAKLFNETFEGVHSSMADVKATKRCYKELIKLKVI